MPTYDYLCTYCGHTLEDEASIKAPPKTDCPLCEEPTLKRQIAGSSFVLKGGGWAKEGYSKG